MDQWISMRLRYCAKWNREGSDGIGDGIGGRTERLVVYSGGDGGSRWINGILEARCLP
jgi:hypothetical protein